MSSPSSSSQVSSLDSSQSSRARVLVPLSLLALYVIWGSTYFAIRVGLESFSPFSMGALRFSITGVVLYVALRLRGVPSPTAKQWRNSGITGILLLSVGNGLVCFAETRVSSGLAAIAVASMPLFAAIFAFVYGHRASRLETIGLLVGFAGVIVLNVGGDLRGDPLGALALLGAAGSWAFGSVWSKKQDMPAPAMNTAAQMMVASVVLMMFALATGEHLPAAPTTRSVLALVYLGTFGSIIGFSAYLYLLANTRPALATSYAYVNPPVAVLFGVLLGNERLRIGDTIGMAVILFGVFVITRAKDLAKR